MAILTTEAGYNPSLDPLTDTSSVALTDDFLLQPSVNLTSNRNPCPPGSAVTFTVTVSGSGGTPTGAVYVCDNFVVIGGASTLSVGTYSLTTSSLSSGTHNINAFYFGDSGITYDSAFAGNLSQVIDTIGPTSVLFVAIA